MSLSRRSDPVFAARDPLLAPALLVFAFAGGAAFGAALVVAAYLFGISQGGF